MNHSKHLLIIVAAGQGSRIQSHIPKQFIEIGGSTILEHTLQNFFNSDIDFEITIVAQQIYFDTIQTIKNKYATTLKINIVEGGKERFHSVKNGIAKTLKPHHQYVWVHDSVRCFAKSEFIKRCEAFVLKNGSALPCIPVRDSIRKVEGKMSKHLKRNKLFIVQTPQIFKNEVIQKAFQQDYRADFTDEATVVEHLEKSVHIMEGDPRNMKITYDIDVEFAKSMLK